MHSKILIIGHRGLGKTSFLNNFKKIKPDCIALDLDEEIAKSQSLSISEIFKNYGEKKFRELELETFLRIQSQFSSEQQLVLVAGAGFQVPEKHDFYVLWLQRKTDHLGRIFLNRPRLNSEVSAYQEYMQKYSEREVSYKKWAHDVLCLLEGQEEFSEFDKEYFDPKFELGGIFTLLPEHFKNYEYTKDILNKIIQHKPKFIELRDDLLSIEQIEFVLSIVNTKNILYSFRSNQNFQTSKNLVVKHNISFDWPIENGICDFASPYILSLHSTPELLSANNYLQDFENSESLENSKIPFFKLALKISNFKELKKYHEWMMQDSSRRVFVPMSNDGQFQWYRLWISLQSPIFFWRFGDFKNLNVAKDQIYFFDLVRQKAVQNRALKISNFAAILGQPVLASRTPLEQYEYFSSKNIPVYAIKIDKEEFKIAMEFLRNLGLKAAAVTSPLKEDLFNLSNHSTEISKDLKSSNTLVFSENNLNIHNTDIVGFQTQLKSEILGFNLQDSNIVVWGGGGTQAMLKKLLLYAIFYSSRTGAPVKDLEIESSPKNKTISEIHDSNKIEPNTIEVLVWAVGRKFYADNHKSCWPDQFKNLKVIIDLNYTQDSPGLEYAQKMNLKYISGITMFREQARAQREFWDLFF